MRTEIDVNFKHNQAKFYPTDLDNFMQDLEGKRLRKKVENVLRNRKLGVRDWAAVGVDEAEEQGRERACKVASEGVVKLGKKRSVPFTVEHRKLRRIITPH